MNNFSTNEISMQQLLGKQLMKLYKTHTLVYNLHNFQNDKTYTDKLDVANECNHIFAKTGLVLLKACHVQMQLILLHLYIKNENKNGLDLQK